MQQSYSSATYHIIHQATTELYISQQWPYTAEFEIWCVQVPIGTERQLALAKSKAKYQPSGYIFCKFQWVQAFYHTGLLTNPQQRSMPQENKHAWRIPFLGFAQPSELHRFGATVISFDVGCLWSLRRSRKLKNQ